MVVVLEAADRRVDKGINRFNFDFGIRRSSRQNIDRYVGCRCEGK